jgi:hypothetical protein
MRDADVHRFPSSTQRIRISISHASDTCEPISRGDETPFVPLP